jgi:hypothetical protein
MSNDTEVYEAEPLPPIKYDVTEAGLQAMREKASQLPAAVSSVKDRQACVSVRKEVRGIRLAVEERRKELKKDALEYGRKVDSIARGITEAIREIEDPIGKRIDAYDAEIERRRQEREEAERQRVQEIQDRIAVIAAIPSTHRSSSAAEIAAEIANAGASTLTPELYEEFLEQAAAAKRKALTELGEMLEEAQERERREAELVEERKRLDAERAELEAQRAAEAEARKAQEEADRIEREKRLAEEAEARRIEEEERLAQREEEQREMERQRAEVEAKREEFEQRLREADAKAAAERAAKQADEAQQLSAELNRRAKSSLSAHLVDVIGLPVELAHLVTEAIVAGDVPHVRFVISPEVLHGS